MTILQLKTAVANYFEKTVADLTVNGQDLGLLALNQVRRQAELGHDFEFQRKLVTVSVDGVTGGSLENAVLYSDGVTAVDVKTVIDIGTFDTSGNLRPVEWTTVAESLVRQREEERFTSWRNPQFEEVSLTYPKRAYRYAVSGASIFRFPKNNVVTPLTLGMEVYAFTADFGVQGGVPATVYIAGSDVATLVKLYTQVGFLNDYPLYMAIAMSAVEVVFWSGGSWYIIPSQFLGNTPGIYAYGHSVASVATRPPDSGWTNLGTATGTVVLAYTEATSSGDGYTDEWTTYGAQYLQWGAICQLNHIFKSFVFRQEGNLPPPEKLRDDGLAAFISWDEARYENNRRHRR